MNKKVTLIKMIMENEITISLKGADLRYANLEGANLKHADLGGADLDYSVMPLWCGDLMANYDDKQIIQQLYHVMSHIKNSKNATKKVKKLLEIKSIITLANEMHRKDVERI